MNSEISVVELINEFKCMAEDGTLLTGENISQNDLAMQIIGTIVEVSRMED